jgi:hypothetical protein
MYGNNLRENRDILCASLSASKGRIGKSEDIRR